MHPKQKAAWFVLIVIGGTLSLYGAAVPALSWLFHRKMAEMAVPALGIFGLICLTGFESLFYRATRAIATQDERDLLLSKQAWTAGMRMFWLAFCLAGMGTWAYFYVLRGLQHVTVPVGLFPAILYAGFVVFMLTRALATLHYYGWVANNGDQ